MVQVDAAQFSDEEAARRRDEALRRALNTPPQLKPTSSAKPVKSAEGDAKAARPIK